MQGTESPPAAEQDVVPSEPVAVEATPVDDDSPLASMSPEAFGPAFARYAGVENQPPTEAVSKDGEPSEPESPEVSAEGEQPEASKSGDEAGISRRTAPARISELEAENERLRTTAQAEAERLVKERDDARAATARREAADAEIAKQSTRHFGDPAEFNRRTTISNLQNDPSYTGEYLTNEEQSELAQWTRNRGLIPAFAPAARQQVLGEWQQFVSERATALAQTLPGVTVESISAAVNPDDLFTAYHHAGAEHVRADLAPKLEKATNELAQATDRIARLEADLRQAGALAASSAPRFPSGGTSASPNGTAHLNRKTTDAHDLMASGFSS